MPAKNTVTASGNAGDAAEQAAVKACTSINWGQVITQVTPAVQKGAASLGKSIAPAFKSLGNSISSSGKSISNAFAKLPGSCCVPGSPDVGGPKKPSGDHSNKKVLPLFPGGGSHGSEADDSFIDYPLPYQEKDGNGATSGSKRVSASFKRLSRGSVMTKKSKRISAIAPPSGFDGNNLIVE